VGRASAPFALETGSRSRSRFDDSSRILVARPDSVGGMSNLLAPCSVKYLLTGINVVSDVLNDSDANTGRRLARRLYG
jgi:hypothetical protein